MVKNRKFTKQTKIILAIIAVVGSLAYGVLAYTNKWVPFTDNDKAFKVDDQGRGINPNKTKQEKADIKSSKEDPSTKTKRPNTDATPQPKVNKTANKNSVYVLMTSVSQSVDKSTVSASGFVTNVAEKSGVCTYIFTSADGSKVIKKQSSALQNPSSTTCKTIQINSSELGAGTWTVSLEYNSETSHGIADGMRLTVE